MWTVLFLKRNKILERLLRRYIVSATEPLRVERAVVLSKMTRYEVEKNCNPNLSSAELEKLIRDRGSNFDSLLANHRKQKTYEQYVLQTFLEKGIDTKLLSRSEYTDSWIDWCDAVFPVGGDGTFLLAASRVRQNTKPVIGINSDPERSEGVLCLPKSYSSHVNEALQRLEEGSFSWMFRTRIRVKLNSKVDSQQAIQKMDKLNWCVTDIKSGATETRGRTELPPPALALNEVFIGESMSAQVSYFEMAAGTEDMTKVKCSGLCVSTGTGSSSWHLSINRITPQCVAQILRCGGLNENLDAQQIASIYNKCLLFDPEEQKLCYTLRDLISGGVWPSPPGLAPRGFAQSVRVLSHCHDARLAIDGVYAYPFNDGMEVILELHSQDTLKTVVLDS